MVRRFLLTAFAALSMFLGMHVFAGVSVQQGTRAQADPCAGLDNWSAAYLAEERSFTDASLAILDTNNLQAIAAASPEQLNQIVELTDTHLKTLDKIDAPAFAANWQRAQAELLDLNQALLADGAMNGIFTVLVDYYDQSLRSDQEIAQARIDATAACPEFDAFATEVDMVDGAPDEPVPGFAVWSGCAGLDDLGIAIDRANLQALVAVPAALQPLAEFGAEWEVDPSIDWNEFQFLSLADYYEALARILEQVPSPEYALPWFQNLIAFDRSVGEIVRGAREQGGIMAASAASGGPLVAITDATEGTIASGTLGCAEFRQFTERYG